MMRWWGILAMVGACGDPGTGTGGTNPGTTGTGTNAATGLADTLQRVGDDEAQVESCGDLLIAGSSPEDKHLLVLTVGGDLAEQARVSGKPVQATFTLPHDDVQLFAVWGAHLRDWYACNDVIFEHPVIDGEAHAISGTVSVTVESSKGATKFMPYAMADAELADVTFETDDGTETEMLEELTWLDQFIGWLAG